MTGELAVGLVLAWMDGAAKIDRFSDGIEDGLSDSGPQRSFGAPSPRAMEPLAQTVHLEEEVGPKTTRHLWMKVGTLRPWAPIITTLLTRQPRVVVLALAP